MAFPAIAKGAKAEVAKYRNGYMAEIDKAIKRVEVAERKNIAHDT